MPIPTGSPRVRLACSGSDSTDTAGVIAPTGDCRGSVKPECSLFEGGPAGSGIEANETPSQGVLQELSLAVEV